MTETAILAATGLLLFAYVVDIVGRRFKLPAVVLLIIPEPDIRRRYQHSRMNLIHLLPRLTALRMYANSAEADPATGRAPVPMLVLHMDHGKIVGPADLARTPGWAKPIVAAALKLDLVY